MVVSLAWRRPAVRGDVAAGDRGDGLCQSRFAILPISSYAATRFIRHRRRGCPRPAMTMCLLASLFRSIILSAAKNPIFFAARFPGTCPPQARIAARHNGARKDNQGYTGFSCTEIREERKNKCITKSSRPVPDQENGPVFFSDYRSLDAIPDGGRGRALQA